MSPHAKEKLIRDARIAITSLATGPSTNKTARDYMIEVHLKSLFTVAYEDGQNAPKPQKAISEQERALDEILRIDHSL